MWTTAWWLKILGHTLVDYAKGCSTRDSEWTSRTSSRRVELVVLCSGGSNLSGVILSENLKHVKHVGLSASASHIKKTNKQKNPSLLELNRPSMNEAVAATAKSRQSCPTLCDPIDSSPPGSAVPGILQARTLEWVAISFSNAWKWKVKGKSLSHVLSQLPHGLQPTRFLRPWEFPGKSTGMGRQCLLQCFCRVRPPSIQAVSPMCLGCYARTGQLKQLPEVKVWSASQRD